MIPSMIYDYKNSFQREVEKAESLRGINLSGKDLREFDFSGKNLSGVTIEGSDLRRAKFHRSILNGAVFKECELLGAEFDKAYLREAKLIDSNLEITRFDYADMQGAQILGSDLWHCSFVESDLTKAAIKNIDIAKAYFYRANLAAAILEVEGIFQEVSFRLCGLSQARFIGDEKNEDNILGDCDFSNSDLSEVEFELNYLTCNNFTKTKMNNADFSKCSFITKSNYNWANCFEINLPIVMSNCTFRATDLSRMKQMKGISFIRNDLSYANLSGYDFGIDKCSFGNKMEYTNLTNSKMINMDLSTSYIVEANFTGAKLIGTLFKEDQLENFTLSQAQLREIHVFR
jgi:uncharacterized protein YjbI with pentapeptide repeats